MKIMLLRGVNVGGKRRLKMADVRQLFTESGHPEAETIGATGVIIYDDPQEKIEMTLPEDIETLVVDEQVIRQALQALPEWWRQDDGWRHNAIFLLNDVKAEAVMSHVGDLNDEYEAVFLTQNIIFWSSSFADRKGYFKSEYSKLMKNPYYKQMTIRNGNTLEKIIAKIDKMKATK
ncbi:hypothetical protein LOSG293_230240 [Secundilactobacillus oryzae JCM 18671]|uniref:DUF1697 domain-containing protein n=1 Tax=Secundilactobacillus oryzae JCM 18671 TaxID=1291743 RepID=A0A081BJQ8_9LACO|nr:DUF1697 domain-containing protein [Secundilactobacillus oryzae]GAK48276.1 hypothetical protein LOSG293_230240 [Secundilactobacillus oryzae JCM 18671]